MKHITKSYLNQRYSQHGETFNTYQDALSCASICPGSTVYRIVNHQEGMPLTDENKITVGWLVCKKWGEWL